MPETMGGPQVKGQRPEHSEAGLGAELRIGHNAAGSQIASAGDKCRQKTKLNAPDAQQTTEAIF